MDGELTEATDLVIRSSAYVSLANTSKIQGT